MVKKFQENADEWSDTSIWPTGMLNIILRVGVDRLIFGQFNFQNEEIDDAIYSYDHGAMELKFFGKRVHLDPNLVSKATKNPRIEGAMSNSWKTPKVEKIQMANKIGGKWVVVPKNGLKMEDVPQGIYKTLIQIILRTIMNHQKRT